jgi:hypothetical protein
MSYHEKKANVYNYNEVPCTIPDLISFIDKLKNIPHPKNLTLTFEISEVKACFQNCRRCPRYEFIPSYSLAKDEKNNELFPDEKYDELFPNETNNELFPNKTNNLLFPDEKYNDQGKLMILIPKSMTEASSYKSKDIILNIEYRSQNKNQDLFYNSIGSLKQTNKLELQSNILPIYRATYEKITKYFYLRPGFEESYLAIKALIPNLTRENFVKKNPDSGLIKKGESLDSYYNEELVEKTNTYKGEEGLINKVDIKYPVPGSFLNYTIHFKMTVFDVKQNEDLLLQIIANG